jgi:hypothetical protein
MPSIHAMSEPLALLLLPTKLEEFELADHARELLAIPRVLALEPGRWRTPRFLRESVPARTARRLPLPGEPRVLVLYHPQQYPLARALCARYEQAELWYIRPDAAQMSTGDPTGDLADLDRLARERATETRVVSQTAAPNELREPLRLRLRELEVISHRPFVPGARIGEPLSPRPGPPRHG